MQENQSDKDQLSSTDQQNEPQTVEASSESEAIEALADVDKDAQVTDKDSTEADQSGVGEPEAADTVQVDDQPEEVAEGADQVSADETDDDAAAVVETELKEPVIVGDTPQCGVLAESNLHGYYITYTLRNDDDLLPYVQDVLARFPSMLDECRRVFDVPSLSGVVAVGADAWPRVYPSAKPVALKPFPEMKQGDRSAPETPCDLFFQIRCDRQDINFVVGQRVHALLGELADLQEAIPVFRYLDSRDLTGFVDGTENPQGDDKPRVALIGPEDPGFAGGSYVHIQRYVHNLPRWNKLDVPDQEQVIGRTKSDNIEFTGDEKPLTSHIKRSGIKDEDGQAVEILRQSMPYGDLDEQGLYFVSYCRFADNFTRMLASMIYSDAKGHYDHLMKYTRAVTGAALFAPSREFLTQYLGAASEAERLRLQRESEKRARLAAEEAERNSTRGELKYTPLSESMDDPVIPVPSVENEQESEPVTSATEQNVPVPASSLPVEENSNSSQSSKRYSATFYQAMIEDDEKEKEQQSKPHVDTSDDGLKDLKSLPWSLTDDGKEQKKRDE
ncbi:Dyp-type peroxidase [Oceanospirillum sediminis]|uniref:Dyp-type peroxidase n=1 Tax=Oceanospirillum sediminis TaxID=2760088 RepID=A0A839ILK7_9GAMM|nr:Dyp-type peroxidase [Oceanospirillum sediminis]MBB1485379.1 Dyp-type peroxidase [Oceanospirillum sediminis]